MYDRHGAPAYCMMLLRRVVCLHGAPMQCMTLSDVSSITRPNPNSVMHCVGNRGLLRMYYMSCLHRVPTWCAHVTHDAIRRVMHCVGNRGLLRMYYMAHPCSASRVVYYMADAGLLRQAESEALGKTRTAALRFEHERAFEERVDQITHTRTIKTTMLRVRLPLSPSIIG